MTTCEWGEFPWGEGSWCGDTYDDPIRPTILHGNIFADGTVSATSTATGYYPSNVSDLRPYTFHEFSAAGTQRISVTLASTATSNGIFIQGHNFSTSSATISVETSLDGLNWIERLAPFTVATDKAFVKYFDAAIGKIWSVKIVTASVAARMAVIILGTRLVFQRYLSGSFDPYPEKINAVSGRSKAGHLIGVTRKNISVEIDAQFRALTATWCETYFRPVWDNVLSQCQPIAWHWDPVNHPLEVYFVQVPPDFTLKMPFDPFRRNISLTFQGIKEV